ncbi:hypothetical protein GLAREA_03951 [Glarea lozoyensis ATCC 20868]|uniref:Uncharacterized protein n=1 Tax=Glarea lozoyensis (strain ATCC 20868 / MF5171) TaxID=1116229 RepID=S3D1E2_GLAL2|nr:uncharacterized protein GLAREA_03951 [Glarea lozoyensis ATCC 20868]EPE30984.1 hypothetical protein GLAREA_03951 [Glarea lozoyensis ATCC 20868]
MSYLVPSSLRSVFYAPSSPPTPLSPCYHLPCFGQPTCIKSLPSGASLLEPPEMPTPATSIFARIRSMPIASAKYSTSKPFSVIAEEPDTQTCTHPACSGMKGLDVAEDVFLWDATLGWAMRMRCQTCRRDRCDRCEVKTFEDVSFMGEKLTVRSEVVVVCWPCRHGFCKGWRISFVVRCRGCGHGVCGECELGEWEVGCCRRGTHGVSVGREGDEGVGKVVEGEVKESEVMEGSQSVEVENSNQEVVDVGKVIEPGAGSE